MIRAPENSKVHPLPKETNICVSFWYRQHGGHQDYFKEKYHRLALRKSNRKAIVAIARKMLAVIWNILYEKKPYNPALYPVYDPKKVERATEYRQKEIERLSKLLTNKVA
jgi:hypothetical protein